MAARAHQQDGCGAPGSLCSQGHSGWPALGLQAASRSWKFACCPASGPDRGYGSGSLGVRPRALGLTLGLSSGVFPPLGKLLPLPGPGSDRAAPSITATPCLCPRPSPLPGRSLAARAGLKTRLSTHTGSQPLPPAPGWPHTPGARTHPVPPHPRNALPARTRHRAKRLA